MTSRLSSNVWKTLTCSYCGQVLSETAAGADCSGCGLHYQYTYTGALDLRLKKARKYHLEVELGTPPFSDDGLKVEPLKAALNPQVDFADMTVPVNMTSELMSYFPKAKSQDSLMLDLACGYAVHKGIIERAGFEWVGADYDDSRQASVLADAHALPFADNTFDCILSIAAIHLFRYPLVMMREAYRVLKPEGLFLGTVAFLEPFPRWRFLSSHPSGGDQFAAIRRIQGREDGPECAVVGPDGSGQHGAFPEDAQIHEQFHRLSSPVAAQSLVAGGQCGNPQSKRRKKCAHQKQHRGLFVCGVQRRCLGQRKCRTFRFGATSASRAIFLAHLGDAISESHGTVGGFHARHGATAAHSL
jgi:SAM-dependent methyltransferase